MTIGDDILMTDKLSKCTYPKTCEEDRTFKLNERVAVKEHIGSYKYIPQHMIYSGKYKDTRIINGIAEHYIEIDMYTHKSKWFMCMCIGQQEETVSHVLLKMVLMSHPKIPLALAIHYANTWGEKGYKVISK
jgi:hypothetical protein